GVFRILHKHREVVHDASFGKKPDPTVPHAPAPIPPSLKGRGKLSFFCEIRKWEWEIGSDLPEPTSSIKNQYFPLEKPDPDIIVPEGGFPFAGAREMIRIS
ncbi:MAG: hypothetical protein WBM17_09840, partial [Anaerolineales bacterium]